MNETPLDPDQRRWLVVNVFWPQAKAKTDESLETARTLSAAGFHTPAFVWAVRSAEIFMRECLLFLHLYEEMGDIRRAFRRTQQIFGKGSDWNRALRFVQEEFDLDYSDALTSDDRDAFAVWQNEGVMGRHNMVHGLAEATPDMAAGVISFVGRFVEYFAQRLVVADRGPLRGVLRALLEEARRLYEEESSREDGSDQEDHRG
jgi:HEPN domain-containing protein